MDMNGTGYEFAVLFLVFRCQSLTHSDLWFCMFFIFIFPETLFLTSGITNQWLTTCSILPRDRSEPCMVWLGEGGRFPPPLSPQRDK